MPLIESILNGGRLSDVRVIVPTQDYFVDRGAGIMYAAMLKLAAEGVPITNETLTPRLDLRDKDVVSAWEKTVGATTCHPGDYAAFFAEEVAENYQSRESRRAVAALHRKAEADDDVTPAEIAEVAEILRGLKPKGSTLHAIKEATVKALDRIENAIAAKMRGEVVMGIPYGIDRIDAATGGMKPGELIIIGARPSVGKTSLGLSIINHASVTAGRKSLFVSLEMTEIQDATRIISMRSGTPYGEIERGELTVGSRGHVSKAISEVAAANLMIETKPGISLPELAAQVHAMAKDGLELVVVDYLGLMRYPKFSSGDNNYKEVSEISKGLKELALGAGVPIVALAQLNRGSAKHSRAPKMSDLRDSGSIEQDADIVILLHRDDEVKAEYESADIEPALAIIDKNRNGSTGRVRLLFRKPVMLFEAWPQDRDWPDDF